MIFVQASTPPRFLIAAAHPGEDQGPEECATVACSGRAQPPQEVGMRYECDAALEAAATELLHAHGCTWSGRRREDTSPRQSSFEKRMIRHPFRGRSRAK